VRSLQPTRPASRRTGLWLFGLVAVALLINVPFGWTLWTRYELAQHGVPGHAVVEPQGERTVAVPEDDPQAWYVGYRLPPELDPQQSLYSTQVEQAAFEEATSSGRVPITYLADDPGTHLVEGQVTHRLAYVLVGFADLALLAMALLYVFVGRKQEKDLLLEAVADVERCAPSWTMLELDDDEWLVTGEVTELFDDGLALESRGGKRVRVRLGRFTNEIGHQQPARVRGRAVDSF
jgi:hypothetical protein